MHLRQFGDSAKSETKKWYKWYEFSGGGPAHPPLPAVGIQGGRLAGLPAVSRPAQDPLAASTAKVEYTRSASIPCNRRDQHAARRDPPVRTGAGRPKGDCSSDALAVGDSVGRPLEVAPACPAGNLPDASTVEETKHDPWGLTAADGAVELHAEPSNPQATDGATSLAKTCDPQATDDARVPWHMVTSLLYILL